MMTIMQSIVLPIGQEQHLLQRLQIQVRNNIKLLYLLGELQTKTQIQIMWHLSEKMITNLFQDANLLSIGVQYPILSLMRL